MDKEYMLNMLRLRIKELEANYRQYFDTVDGPSKSKSGAACMRSRIKKDLDILKLIEYILMSSSNNITLTDVLLTNTFDRLTEPKRG